MGAVPLFRGVSRGRFRKVADLDPPSSYSNSMATSSGYLNLRVADPDGRLHRRHVVHPELTNENRPGASPPSRRAEATPHNQSD